MSDTYRLVGSHSEDLADGRTLGPGAEVKLSSTQPSEKNEAFDSVLHPTNKGLIDRGRLVLVKRGESKAKPSGKKAQSEGDQS